MNTQLCTHGQTLGACEECPPTPLPMSLGSLDIVDRAVTAAVADLLVDRDEFRTLDVAAHATVVSAHGRRATHPQFNALIGKNLSTNDSKLGIIRSSPDAQTNARWRRRTAGT